MSLLRLVSKFTQFKNHTRWHSKSEPSLTVKLHFTEVQQFHL